MELLWSPAIDCCCWFVWVPPHLLGKSSAGYLTEIITSHMTEKEGGVGLAAVGAGHSVVNTLLLTRQSERPRQAGRELRECFLCMCVCVFLLPSAARWSRLLWFCLLALLLRWHLSAGCGGLRDKRRHRSTSQWLISSELRCPTSQPACTHPPAHPPTRAHPHASDTADSLQPWPRV